MFHLLLQFIHMRNNPDQTLFLLQFSAEVIALRRLSGSMLREILDGAAQPRPKFEPRLWPCALPRPEGRGLPRCFFDQPGRFAPCLRLGAVRLLEGITFRLVVGYPTHSHKAELFKFRL